MKFPEYLVIFLAGLTISCSEMTTERTLTEEIFPFSDPKQYFRVVYDSLNDHSGYQVKLHGTVGGEFSDTILQIDSLWIYFQPLMRIPVNTSEFNENYTVDTIEEEYKKGFRIIANAKSEGIPVRMMECSIEDGRLSSVRIDMVTDGMLRNGETSYIFHPGSGISYYWDVLDKGSERRTMKLDMEFKPI